MKLEWDFDEKYERHELYIETHCIILFWAAIEPDDFKTNIWTLYINDTMISQHRSVDVAKRKAEHTISRMIQDAYLGIRELSPSTRTTKSLYEKKKEKKEK